MSSIVKKVTREIENGVIISLLEGEGGIDFIKEMYNNGYVPPKYYIVNFYLRYNTVQQNFEYLNGNYVWINHYDVINNRLTNPENSMYKIFHSKYSQYSETNELNPSSVLSVFLLHDALTHMNLTDDEIPYTIEGILDEIHEGRKLEDFPKISGGVNNHVTYSLGLYTVTYNEKTKEYEVQSIYSNYNEIPANPYNGHYIDKGYITCDTTQNVTKIYHEYIYVGLLISTTGIYNNLTYSAIDPIIGKIDDLNKKGGINGYYLDYIIYDLESSSNNCGEVIDEAIKNEKIKVFIGTFLNKCRKIASEKLKVINQYLWYPTVFQGEECLSNVFYTGLVANQFVDPLMDYITTLSDPIYYIYFLGYDGEFSDILFYTLNNKFTFEYATKSVYANDRNEMDEAAKLILSSGQGIIITTLGDSEFASFLTYFNKYFKSVYKYKILGLNMDRSLINLISFSNTYEILFVGSYFDEIKSTSDFKTLTLSSTGRSFNTMYGDSSYMAIEFWSKAVIEAKSFDPEKYIPYLYNMEIESGVGTVKMNTNHYSSLYIYIAKWISNTKDLEIVYHQSILQIPMAYNWDLELSNGFICDYSDENIGEKKYSDPIDVLLVIAESGSLQSLDSGLLATITLVTNTITDYYDKKLNRKIYLTTIDYESNDIVCYNKVIESLNERTADVIFTTSSTNCIDMILSEISELDIPIFDIGYNGGEACYEQVFFASKEPSVIGRIIDVYYDENDASTKTYHLIGTTSDYSTKSMEYLKKYLEHKSLTVGSQSIISPDQTDFTDIVNNIFIKSPDGSTIFFFGTEINHIGFHNTFVLLGYNTNNIHFISFTTGENMIGSGVLDFYSTQSFFSALNTEESVAFVDLIRSYTSTAISELMVSAYSIYRIWYESVLEAESTKLSDIISKLQNHEFKSPEGLIKLSSNHYLSHYLSFAYFEENKFNILYSSSSYIKPTPYKRFVNDGIYTCDFTDSSIGSKRKSSSITIGILNSLSGMFSVTERAITDGIELAVQEINDEGGLLGNYILTDVRDPGSVLVKYADEAAQLCKLEEVKAVFGVGRYATLMTIYSVFDQYKKPFFYPGVTSTEFCSSYTYTTQSTTNQLSRAFQKYVYPYYSSFIIITDPTNIFCDMFLESVKTALEATKSIIYGVFSDTDLQPLVDLGMDVISESAIICVSGADANKNIFSYLCPRGITGRTAHIYSSTLDERILQDLDEECLKGVHLVTTFAEGLKDNINGIKTFVEKSNNIYGSNIIITPAMESGYTAVKFWADVVKHTYSFDIDDLRKTIYGYSYDTATGIIEMNTNGLGNRVVFLVEVTDNKKFKLTQYISTPFQSESYDQLMIGNEGYTCDWTDKGDYYLLPTYKLIFLHETGNNDKQIIIQAEEIYEIQQINYNLLNGHYIVPVFLFTDNNYNYTEELLPYFEDESAFSIIGCSNIKCRDSVKSIIKGKNMLFIYTGKSEGNTCGENRINIGPTSYQMLYTPIEYLSEKSVRRFYILGEDTDEYILIYFLEFVIII